MFELRNGRGWGGLLSVVLLAAVALGAEAPALKLELKPAGEGLLAPEGYTVSLIASDPLVVNPAAMALAPDGRIFVCEDFVHAKVPGHTRDNVKVLLGAENGGPATQAKLICDDLNSVQGLCFHDGYLYIAHSPKISRIKVNPDNSTGPLEDLFNGVGLDRPFKPAHGAASIVFHDGKLYHFFGDQGCDFTDREGRRHNIDTGAIVRFDPDGSNFEVFALGFRNLYGFAIDPFGDFFARDNTNDGGGYNVRNYHIVKGAYYGWPFRWREGDSSAPPPDVLTKSLDLGGGSPCAAHWLRCDAFPEPVNNAMLACEWGRGAIVLTKPGKTGATYTLPETRFLADARTPGAKHDFRPTVIALARDNSLIIADWATGPLYPTEKKGRILRVRYTGPAPVKAAVLSPADHAAQFSRATPPQQLLEGLASPEWPVRARCAFLLGELKHAAAAPQLEALLKDAEPAVRLRAATALGDLKDPRLIPVFVRAYAAETERWTRHLLVRGLRDANDPQAVLAALRSAPEALQPDLLHALRDQYDPAVAGLLLATAGDAAAPVPLRAKAVEFLGLIAKKEAKRWTWGDRPTIQPSARTEDWSESVKIVAALRAAVRDEAFAVRSAALAALQKINDTTVVDALLKDLDAGRAKLDATTAQILVGSTGAEKAAPLLGRFLNDPAADASVRLEIARAFGLWSAPESLPPLRAAAADSAAPAALRAAALDALGRRKDAAALDTARAVLKDAPPEAQRAAARALGALGDKAAEPALLAALESPDRALKSQALLALWRLNTASGNAAVLRTLVALPASEDALQMEILDGLGASLKSRLEPALLVWAEFGTPSKGAELELAERFEKWAKNDFGLASGSREKRAAGLKKLAEHRAKAYPKFAVPENLKPAAAAPAEDEEARLARLTQAAATATGDPVKGAAVFRNTQAANCIACHIVGKEGRRVGPELSEVASKYARAQLVESVLYPSKQLLDGYEQSVLVLKSGERLSGIVMNETPEKLDVAKSDGSTVTVPLRDVAKRQKSKNSLMPDGLANPLSDQEFFDLIAYMETLKK